MVLGSAVKVMVVGSGAREHALSWKLSQSPLCRELVCAPGNPGISQTPKCTSVPIQASDFPALIKYAKENQIDFTVIGPDNQLADGIVDAFEKENLRVFGPRKDEAKLEWSKSHAKKVMGDLKIPTARFVIAESLAKAKDLVAKNPWAQVVKVDGLALGKGVYVCDSAEETLHALSEIFDQKKFGDSGSKVILEEKLSGPEASLLVLCDGKTITPLLPARDFKRRYDADTGRTGGMGSIAPVAFSPYTQEQIESQILAPIKTALKNGKLSYRGVLYIGLMLMPSAHGDEQKLDPYVIEFNARFGDPEAQAILPLLESDLLPALWACSDGTLSNVELRWRPDSCCCVVISGKNYPASGSKGSVIEISEPPQGSAIFHAGTASKDGKVVTNGGRVLSVTAWAKDHEDAHKAAYAAIKHVSFDNMDYRKDIGERLVPQCR